MNQLTIIGNLMRAPESRAVGDGTVCNFDVAVNRDYKRDGQPDADFFRVAAWGKTGDTFYPVDLSIRAQDRSGLLRDLSEVFAKLRLNVVGVNTQSKGSLAHMVFTVEIRDGSEMQRALSSLAEVTGVISAIRR